MSKTDDQLRSEIESSETRGEWGAWAVVVGLVLEIGLAAANSLGYGKAAVENWGAVAADCLIALGVYAEIHFGRRASHSGAELRRRSDERVADANTRAAEANARAKQADVERERLRESFQRSQAFRMVDVDKFVKELADVPPARVELLYDRHVWDASTLKKYIAAALQQAKWDIDPVSQMRQPSRPDLLMWHEEPNIFFGQGLFGISIFASKDVHSNAIRALQNAIFKSGAEVFVTVGTDTALPDNTFRLIVGPKAGTWPSPPASAEPIDANSNSQSVTTKRE